MLPASQRQVQSVAPEQLKVDNIRSTKNTVTVHCKLSAEVAYHEYTYLKAMLGCVIPQVLLEDCLNKSTEWNYHLIAVEPPYKR